MDKVRRDWSKEWGCANQNRLYVPLCAPLDGFWEKDKAITMPGRAVLWQKHSAPDQHYRSVYNPASFSNSLPFA